MPGYTNPFGGSSVQPSQVAFREVILSANTLLTWPSVATDENFVARTLSVTALSAGLSLTMPDCRVVSDGFDVLFTNPGVETYTVKDNDGNTIVTVASGEAQYILLRDNVSNQGVWLAFQFASLTSAATAASLVGSGMRTDPDDATRLSVKRLVEAFNSTSRSIINADVAMLLDWTGGSATWSPGAASDAPSMGDGFFFGLRNSGSGTLEFDGGGSNIDGVASMTLLPGEACELISNGAEWRSVGRGRSATFNWTRLVKAVSTGTYALTVSECSRVIHEYTGALLGDVTITLQPIVQVYFIQNSTVHATRTVTFTTGLGTSVSLTQSQNVVLICDGTDVINASTTLSGFTSLLLAQGSAAAPSYSFSGSTDTGMYQPSTGEVAWSAGGVQKIRAATTGVLIGGQTSRSVGGAVRQLQIEAASAQASISVVRNSADTTAPSLVFGKSRGAATGGVTVLASGDSLGQVLFVGADGTDVETPGAAIEVFVDGTPGANDMPGRIVFSTTADGAATVTERMRISSAGIVSITGSLTTTGNATIGDAATDTLTVQAGSAALPSIIPSGDPNTGEWFPAADTIAWSTGGAEGLRLDGTNVTTTRNVSFSRSGSTTAARADTTGYLALSGGTNTSDGMNFILGGTTTSAFAGLTVLRYGTNELMRVTSAGLVGIGMTPTNRLDVTHSQNATSAIRLINADAGAGAQASLIASNGTNTFSMTMRGTGHASVNDALLAATGATTNIVFNTNGADRAELNTSGQFTIGPSMTVARRLTVGDDASAAEFIQIRTSTAGTSGVLFSDDSTAALNQGGILYDHSTDTGTLRASNTAIVNFTSTTFTVNGILSTTGNVLVGTASTDLLVVQAGSAALPSITPTGDANTGIWFPAADTVAVSTAGAEVARFDSSQRLLVGATTSLTSARAEVVGASTSTTFGAQNFATENGVGITARNSSSTDSSFASVTVVATNALGTAQAANIIAQSVASGHAPNLIFAARTASGATTERARLDSSGNFGVGGTAPAGVRIYSAVAGTASASSMRLGNDTDAGYAQIQHIGSTFATASRQNNMEIVTGGAAADIGFLPNGTERARFTVAGELLVGDTTARTLGPVVPKLQVSAADATASISVFRHTAVGATSRILMGASRGAAGTPTIVQVSDTLGTIEFVGADGTDYATPAASIAVVVDGTPGANDMPGRIVFSTTADGAGSVTERARIDSTGNTTFGGTTPRAIEVAGAGNAGAVNAINAESVTSGSYSGLTLVRNDDVSVSLGTTINLARTRGATLGSVTIVQNGDVLGGIAFSGADGTDIRTKAAEIVCQVDGTPSLNDMPGRLIFSTTADGAATPTERMRVTSAGQVGIGMTPVNRLDVTHTQNASSVGQLTNADAGTGADARWVVGNGTNTAGLILRGTGFTGAANNALLFVSGANPITFSTNGITRATIDGSGNTNFAGSVSLDGNLTVGNASTDILIVQSGSAALPSIVPTGDLNTGIWFPAADAAAISTGGSERIRIPSTGQLLVGVTSANVNGGVLQLSSGITFPATQVASTDANTLDDYEEGTFTPALSGTGCTFSYASRSGSYTKIGRQVHVYISIQLNNTGNTLAANAVTITGLPFTAAVSGVSPVSWAAMATGFVNMNGVTSGTSVVLQGITAANITSTGAVLGTHFDATGFSTINISLSFSV